MLFTNVSKLSRKKTTPRKTERRIWLSFTQTSFELAKLYAPSVLLGVASITSILASNNILRKRNVALTAAYATLDKCFKEYRGNVVERFGEQVDRELRYAIKAKKFEETVVDEKTGKEKTVKNKVDVVGIDGISDYAKFSMSTIRTGRKTPSTI